MNNSIDIKPMDMSIDKTKYEKLEISRDEIINIVEPFIRQLPDIILDRAYTFTLPTSMSELLNNVTDSRHLLVNLINSDGASNILSLVKLRPSVMLFSTLAIASIKMVIKDLDTKLNIISTKLDKILEFLYGDKKAEIIAEMQFIRYAYTNFESIFKNETHRLATLTNIQASKRIAMKNIEFYLADLDAYSNKNTKNDNELKKLSNDILNIKDSLELSVELFFSSSVLEIYYSDNHDKNYIENTIAEVNAYLEECHRRNLKDIALMAGRWEAIFNKDNKGLPVPLPKLKQHTPNPFNDVVESTSRRETINISKKILDNIQNPIREYIVTENGEVYIPKQ
nr:hypothetical protein [uncultured Lachnoanaerobaculum sp.]